MIFRIARRRLDSGFAWIPVALFVLYRPISNLRTMGLAHAGVNALTLAQHERAEGVDVSDLLETGTGLLEMRLDRDRGDAETWQHLARAWYLRGDLAEAERVLREGMGSVRQPQKLHEDLIRLLAGSSQADKAIRELGPYLRANPRAWSTLGVALARRGRIEEAAQVLRAGVQRFPQDPTIRANLDRVEEELR